MVQIRWGFLCRAFTSPQTLTLYFFTWSAMYSEVRQPRAEIVSVGFLSALLTNGAASVMNRFFTSQAWQYWFSTDVFGSFPIFVAPTSWIIWPPRAMPQLSLASELFVTTPPMVLMISWNVSCMCLACKISSWLHLKWKRSTGIPH